MEDGPVWAIEGAPNPTVLRVHVRWRLTDRTIVSSPPEPVPAPFDRFPELDGVRSIDLHPYRVRVNLAPGGGRGSVITLAKALLETSCGPAMALGVESLPRAFAHPYAGSRRVAESQEMADATGVPVVASLFTVMGVAEVVLGPGVVLVRLGRLFDWGGVGSDVAAAVARAQ